MMYDEKEMTQGGTDAGEITVSCCKSAIIDCVRNLVTKRFVRSFPVVGIDYSFISSRSS